ncbi:sigma-70 family RNA polymerase sigma factor [Arthrobacter sp. ISL-95]|uniref:sigma-70 family RNA polymerase sigma factor n=1 Tax=Arthrobacter sp. ISL-95 TaxID=2819116 RepID=UPI001BEBC3D0|nr:sigma-70 family RNA polymerase sigma factor [Arthrobacter sp. ISL-95]MBT2584801.1 sigma-70 family RNA polymerase sigma factor [Arthrobacter sp. ISL-95]
MAHTSHASNNSGVDDRQLIELVRNGDMSAFDGLYERHFSVASSVARRNVDNQSDAEDVVAEAFQSVLQSLVSGKGPDAFFRAYLLSTVARLSHQRNRKAGRVLPSGDDSVLNQTLADSDAAIGAFESNTVAKAFRALPERWQAVLWYLDVERMKPAAVAPILGLSANAVSALALRAREGLRRQYLQFHLSEQTDTRCYEYASKLGNYIRGGVSSTTERNIRGHLDGCAACTAALAELTDVQGSMRAVLLPLVTGIPAALWAGKGAGLGIVGGMVPAKVAVGVLAFAQPAVMAVIATAAVGLVLGAVGIVDHLTPDAYMNPRAMETGLAPREKTPVIPAPSATSAPAPVPSTLVAPLVTPPSMDVQPVEAPPAVEKPTVENPAPVSSFESPAAPSAAPLPVTTPSAVPLVMPSAPPIAVVDGSAREAGDRDLNGSVMDIDFRVSGSNPLSTGKAVFSVGKNSWILEDSVRAPEGWTCSFESRTVVSCSTDSVQRSDLRFQLGASSKSGRDYVNKDERVFTYTLSGPGLASKRFSALY